MHLLTVLLYTVVAVTPTLTQDDTWALPTPDITAWASEGIISLFPFTTTGPAPTLATPTGVADPHPASSCTAQPWKLHGVNSFHADPDNEVINYSHVEFYFNDTNANLESYCTHDFPANSGEVFYFLTYARRYEGRIGKDWLTNYMVGAIRYEKLVPVLQLWDEFPLCW